MSEPIKGDRRKRGKGKRTLAVEAAIASAEKGYEQNWQIDGVARARESTSEALVLMLNDKGTMELAVEALIRNLHAKTIFMDKKTGAVTEAEDGATQVRAATALLANEVGEPVKRQQILTGQVESLEDVTRKLATNPELRKAFKKLIADAEEKSRIVPE